MRFVYSVLLFFFSLSCGGDLLSLSTKQSKILLYKRMQEFLDLVRPHHSFTFSVHTENSVPTEAGLASSALRVPRFPP
jgi:mevalonate pyrophosphate decarboxylase